MPEEDDDEDDDVGDADEEDEDEDDEDDEEDEDDDADEEDEEDEDEDEHSPVIAWTSTKVGTPSNRISSTSTTELASLKEVCIEELPSNWNS